MSIYEKAIARWGEDKQIIVAVEEMSELQKALCKHLRGEDWRENIIEEIADIEIMFDQLKIIFNISTDVVIAKERKIARLYKILEGRNE